MWRALSAQWVATFFVGGVSLPLGIWVARQIGPAALGEYAVALAAGAILSILIDGGIRNLLMREFARASPQLGHLKGDLPAFAFGHALLVSIFVSICALLFMSDHLAIALATVACFLGVVLVQYASAILRGLGKFNTDAGFLVGQRTVSAALIVMVVLAGFQAPWHILAAWGVGSLLGVLLLLGGLRLRPAFAFPSEVYRVALPLLWIDLATVVYFRSDMLVLQWVGVAPNEIGQYAAAYRLIEAVILFAYPVALLLFRQLRCFAPDDPELAKRVVKAVLLAAVAGLIAASLLAWFASLIITFIYGERYSHSAELLAVLAWALAFALPNAVLTQAALALELDRAYLWAAILAAMCNVSVNIYYAGAYGPIASAWSTILTEATLALVLVPFIVVRLSRGMDVRGHQ